MAKARMKDESYMSYTEENMMTVAPLHEIEKLTISDLKKTYY